MCLFIHFYSSYFSYYIIYGLAGQCLKAAPKSTEAPRPHISATSARPTQEEKEGGPRWGAHGHRVRVPEVRGGRPPWCKPSTGSQGSRPKDELHACARTSSHKPRNQQVPTSQGRAAVRTYHLHPHKCPLVKSYITYKILLQTPQYPDPSVSLWSAATIHTVLDATVLSHGPAFCPAHQPPYLWVQSRQAGGHHPLQLFHISFTTLRHWNPSKNFSNSRLHQNLLLLCKAFLGLLKGAKLSYYYYYYYKAHLSDFWIHVEFTKSIEPRAGR